MRKMSFLSLVLLIVSCGETSTENVDLENKVDETEELIVKQDSIDKATPNHNEPGIYQEFHPNGQLKIEGLNNMYGNREGLWIAYYENRTKWSENYYTDGVKSGHSVTFFPSGSIRYAGEYKNDERIGIWKFYDEKGNLSSEENFSN